MDSNLNKVLNANRHQLCGQLYKYTNVVKGWQYRWFNVDPQAGTLSYYLCESSDELPPTIIGNSPRGQVHLASAVVCPSDEDSRTFSVNCASGDMLKLRATDARSRQEWVDGLRAIAECHTKVLGLHASTLPPREHLAASDALGAARQQLHQLELCNAALAKSIEKIENSSSSSCILFSTDPDLLVLKALSAANTHTLLQCLGFVIRHHELSDNRMEQSF